MTKKLSISVFVILIAALGIFLFYKKTGRLLFTPPPFRQTAPASRTAAAATSTIVVVPGKTAWDYKVIKKDATGLRVDISAEPCLNSRIYKSIAEAARAKEVCILNLSSNNLAEFPAGILKFGKLTELHLESNKLTKLPPEIGGLVNLNALYLAANKLTELPAEIGNLTNLAVLQAQNNNLTALPFTIGNLKNLTELSLFVNNLTDLPATIAQLKKLRFLGLKGNNFSDGAPAKIQGMLPKTRIVF